MKLKIGAKISLGFALVLLMLVVISAVSIALNRTINKEVAEINNLNQKLGKIKLSETHFYKSVSGIRGFIAYGTDRFKNDFIKEINTVLEYGQQLYEITPNPDERAMVQQLIIQTTKYRDGITQELIPAVERQFRAADMQTLESSRAEVVRIAGNYVQITGQITEIVMELVEKNNNNFNEVIAAAERNTSRVITVSIIMSIIALLAGAVLSWFIARSIKNPIVEMVHGADKYAKGDFTNELKIKSNDELGDLVKSLNAMSVQLRTLISGVINNAQTLAAHSQQLAASAEEVSATVEEVASTTNEVSAMAEKSMENADLTSEESKVVAEVAETGVKTVKQTIEKINSISNSSEKVNNSIKSLGELSAKIGNITDVITGIADQTNLLALNAAIEAARAGDQGRGFAVVAEEVRKLAEQSASAAREIGQLITKIQSGVDVAIQAMDQGTMEVSEGVRLASMAGEALENITQAISKNIDLVSEISIQARQTSEGMQQLSASNEQVTSTVQQVAGSTQELADIANKLQASVAKFKV